ncbi:hypothetical protein V6N11_001231 [Hibiscus sabdariffa]|uniref:Uncharacterized protein n=1 Tax=Hibiscus sabdariffa TaxID=183260 RepID=A0ABR2RZ47_9ROSI
MVPQRIHIFLWLTINHKLMSNLGRDRHSLSVSASCPLCGSETESILFGISYVLLTIAMASLKGFGYNLMDIGECYTSKASHSDGIPWNLVFASITCHLWKVIMARQWVAVIAGGEAAWTVAVPNLAMMATQLVAMIAGGEAAWTVPIPNLVTLSAIQREPFDGSRGRDQ